MWRTVDTMKMNRTPTQWQSDCPTPRKMRYPTKHMARNTANMRGRSVGVPLYTYHCKCGSYHLTRQRQEITSVPEVQVHGLGHVLGMDDDAFLNVVISDVMGNLDETERGFLRHVQVVHRWRAGLITVRQRVESELSAVNKLRKPSAEDDEWRALLLEMVDGLTARQHECTELWKTTPRLPSAKKIMRRTAGDRATEILVERHLDEFVEIFHAEAARVGLNTTDTRVESDTLRELRKLHPPNVDVEQHEPRFPNAHLVLTGEESFDDVASLALGIVYQHVRDDVEGPMAAGRVLRDMALQIERCTDRTLTGLSWVIHEWLIIHM